jgi:hypothetical protein
LIKVSEEKDLCFVIMPFSETTERHTEDYWNTHFEDFLKPLIEENENLEAHRSKPLREGIRGEIIKHLVVSPVVIADLTDNNPNVFWELGVRQSFKHGTITIAEEGWKPPFDISDKGILFYSDDHIKDAGFRNDFKLAAKDCLDHPQRPDSHVLETLSGRGTLFEIFHRDQAVRRLNAVQSEMNINDTLWKYIETLIQEKKEDPTHKVYPLTPLRNSATELLVTDRYVDEDEKFFIWAERYSSEISLINHRIGLWPHYRKDITEGLEKQRENWMKVSSGFREKVDGARHKIAKQF